MLFRSKIDQLLTFLGIAGFIASSLLAPQIFPNAAVDLSVPRQAIHQQGSDYLESHMRLAKAAESENTSKTEEAPAKLDLSTYQWVQQFGHDRSGSIYLQRTLGIPETKQLTQSAHLPLYYWSLRWFQPSEQEEFRTAFSPAGEVISFDHLIPEAAPGKTLTESDAQAIAENFLREDRQWTLDDWELVDASNTQRPNRTDHTFNWKQRDFAAEDAELRLTVGIQGDQVAYYSHWIKTPESFSRDFRKDRDKAWFFSNVFYLINVNVPLSVAFIFFVIALVRQQINWRAGLPPALIFFAVSLLARLNTLPLDKSYYSTTQSYLLFWIQAIYNDVLYAAIAAIPMYFLWIGGVQIAKRVWPQRDMIFPRSPNRLNSFTQSYWRGIMMAGICLGYVVVFYGISTRFFGSWSPMSINYSTLFSTPLPFLSPLRNGILPAISEELAARLVGIGMTFLVFRRWWLALIIPGMIWAFAHLGYVSYPIYLRGIELSITAVLIYGVFFLCFGLLTTMVGHCVYNALLGTSLLLKADDPYLFGCGLFMIGLLLCPLFPGLIQQWQQPEKLRNLDKPLDVGTVSSDDYTLLRRLPLVNYSVEDIFSQDSFSQDLQPTYEATCLKVTGEQSAIEGVAIAQLISPQTAIIQQVYVSPKYRRCYHGTRLVSALSQRLKQRGIQHIEVQVNARNPIESLFWANQPSQIRSRKLQLT
ncbi:MAG: GNAT family N-acetyltransferase [Cyanobacteria bacterium P01_A01_bin.116]